MTFPICRSGRVTIRIPISDATHAPYNNPHISSYLLPQHARRLIRLARITCPVISSFPSICETLQHLYQWDSYYFTHLQGGKMGVGEAVAPKAYTDLKRELPELHD